MTIDPTSLAKIPECPPRKHDYAFNGNHKFTQIKSGPLGTVTQLSVRALYVCKICGKPRVGPPNRKHPFPKL